MENPKNITNCTAKLINPDTTVDIGVTNLGKYTLPNIAAFPVNVADVFVRHVEKYVQTVVPNI